MANRALKGKVAKESAFVLIVVWLVSAAIDLAVSLSLGPPAPVGYYLLCGLLGVAVSAGLGFALGLVGIRYEITIALWAALSAHPGRNAILAIAFGVVVWLVLRLSRRVATDPAVSAIRMGIACGVALTAWPAVNAQLMGPAGVVWSLTHWEITPLFAPLIMLATFFIVGVAVTVRSSRSQKFRESLAAVGVTLLVYAGGLQWAQLDPTHQVQTYPPDSVEHQNPDVLLIVLDTVRADRLSLYGYERPTTPRLDEFVTENENAIVYPLAFSNANWTLPSHASLFSGTLPSVHGTHGMSIFTPDGEMKKFSLKADRTLAEVLRGAGYRTGATTANGALDMDPGLPRGFDSWIEPRRARELGQLGEMVRSTIARNSFYDATAWTLRPYATGEAVNEDIIALFEACEGGPCFVFANYMDAHGPYLPPPPHAGLFVRSETDYPPDRYPRIYDSEETLKHFSSRYDEQIHSLDAHLGELLNSLSTHGILDDAWLIITADHGESFGEHGVTQHTSSLYNEQVRIPLIIKPPRGFQLDVTGEPVSLIDITATLSEIAVNESLGSGMSLIDVSAPREPVQMQFYGANRIHRLLHGAPADPMRAVARRKIKLIDNRASQEVYDLEIDITEQNNLMNEARAGEWDDLMGLMLEMPVEHYDDSMKQGHIDFLTSEDRRKLKALGYIY